MADFLLEIGTEEIPAAMIAGLYTDLKARVEAGLRSASLPFEAVLPGGAPRRFGLLVQGLPARQEDRSETVAGPPLAAAKDAEGNWTQAALGFARKQGVDVTALREVQGAKGPCAGFEREVKGRATAEILAEVVPAAVEALYLPKTMRWGSGEQSFVRPVRWVVALLDEAVVPFSIKGTPSGRTSRGHRLHGREGVDIPSVRDYFKVLRQEKVIPDPEERRRKIQIELKERAAEVGGSVPPDSDLLETVTYLTEYPSVVRGEIPGEFLSLPPEILVTCLKEHQKFFVAVDGEGKPLPHFLSVMDGPSDPQGFVRRGNENVSRSRLADARFFYEHDKAVPLDRRLEELKGIVFHPKIGTYHDKAVRTEAIARLLAKEAGADEERAAWAALHCKCDLASLLVQEKEFTSLQGIAGGLYAAAQGGHAEAAEAIYDHYRPLSTDDALPRGKTGAIVALADKLDTLKEMFRAGFAPSGSKDPFALRRAALGLLRILVEREDLPVDLGVLLEGSSPHLGQLREFLAGRLRFLWEQKGYPYDEVNAVLAFGLQIPWLLNRKLAALHSVRTNREEDFDHLSVAFKRAKNILKGIPEYPLAPNGFLPDSDKEGAGERALYNAIMEAEEMAGPCLSRGLHEEALRELSKVRPAVDKFFDDVLVMCDPEGKDHRKTALQENRLALLQRLVALFNRVADFSEIVPRKEA